MVNVTKKDKEEAKYALRQIALAHDTRFDGNAHFDLERIARGLRVIDPQISFMDTVNYLGREYSLDALKTVADQHGLSRFLKSPKQIETGIKPGTLAYHEHHSSQIPGFNLIAPQHNMRNLSGSDEENHKEELSYHSI